MNEATMAKVNFSIAGALMTSHWWLEQLTTASNVMTLLLPFIGAAVGLVQLWRLLRK